MGNEVQGPIDKSARDWFNRGMDLFHYKTKPGIAIKYERDRNEAKECFTKAINIDPNFSEAYAERGNIIRAQRNYDEALKDLDKSLSIQKSASAFFIKSIALIERSNQDKKKASKYFQSGEEMLSKDPNPSSFFHKGLALTYFDKPRDSIDAFDKALSLKPDYIFALYMKGRVFESLNRKMEQMVVFEKANSLNPDLFEIYHDRVELVEYAHSCTNLKPDDAARAYYTIGMYRYCDDARSPSNYVLNQAVINFDKAISLKPDHALAYYSKGRVLEKLGKHADANAALDKAVSLRAEFANVYNSKGNASKNLDQHTATEAASNKGNSSNSNLATAKEWFDKGDALLASDEYTNSIAAFDKAISIKPDYADAYYFKGLALIPLSKYSDAIAAFDKAISLNSPNAHKGKKLALELLEKENQDIAKNNSSRSNSGSAAAQDWFDKGCILYSSGNKEEAIACYDKAISLNPNDTKGYSGKAVVLSSLGRHRDAIVCYDKVISLDPENANIYYFKGDTLNSLGRHADAIACYDKAITLNPDFANAYIAKGGILESLGRYIDAIAVFDKLISLKPDHAETYYKKGFALNKLGKYTAAITAFDKAISLDPSLVIAHYIKEGALNGLNKYKNALANFDEVIKLNPNDADAYNTKGKALEDLDQHIDAIAAYEKAINLEPDNAEAHYNMGFALCSLGLYTDAIVAFDKAIILNSDYMLAYNGKGVALRELGQHTDSVVAFNKATRLKDLEQYTDAIADFDKVISSQPNNALAYTAKGFTLNILDKYIEAIAVLDKAISLDPNGADAYLHKGFALKCLDRYAESLVAFTKATSLNPHSTEAYIGKGNALCALGKYNDAVAAFDKAISLDPNNASAYNSKGHALVALGKYKDAIACFDKAISLEPNYAICYCNKGRTLNILDREQEALECFNKAYELSRAGNLRLTSESHVNYINETLTQDREALLQKLANLQQEAIDAEKIVGSLKDTEAAQRFTQVLSSKKKEFKEVIDKVVDDINTNSKGDSTAKDLGNVVSRLQNEMRALQQEIRKIKEQQEHHTKQHEQHDMRLNAHEAKLFDLQTQTKLLTDLSAKGQANVDMIKSTLFTNIKLQAEHKKEVDTKLGIIASEVAKGKAKSDLVQHILKDINETVKQHGTRLDAHEAKLFDLQTQTELLISLNAKGQANVDMIKSTLFNNIKLQGEHKQEVDMKLGIMTSEVAKGKAKSDLVQCMLKDINETVKQHGTRLDAHETKLFDLQTQTELLINLSAKGQANVDMIKSTLFAHINLQGEHKQEVDMKLGIITSEVAKGKAKSDLVQSILKDINDIVRQNSKQV